MRRCSYCRRLMGPKAGLDPNTFTDGICRVCWPGALASMGLSPSKPYPEDPCLLREVAAQHEEAAAWSVGEEHEFNVIRARAWREKAKRVAA